MNNKSFRNKSLVVFTSLIILVACRKNSAEPDQVQENNSIVIEGMSYPTIRIGNQRWTSANYNGPGGLTIEPGKNWPGYGKLYSQEEAMSLSLPPGWRIPTPEDYRELCRAAGILLPEKGNSEQTTMIETLMSAEAAWIHCAGTNASGFNALPAGYIYVDFEVGQGLSAKMMTSEKVGIVRTYFHISRSANSTTTGLRSVSTPEFTAIRFVSE